VNAWRGARAIGSVLISVVFTLALWIGFLRFYHLSHDLAKDPLDVYRYIFTQRADPVHLLRSAADNRAELFGNLRTTLRDALLGYAGGLVFAMAVACIFVVNRIVEQTFMPLALVLRSVPLVAMTPLITLIFGRDVLGVAVIGTIVCFFPALVNISFGMRATPRSSLDLMASYGASRWTTLRKVLVPSAMPSIFASLRINVPASIIGALLAEFLATGRGSGAEMQVALNTSDYGALWSAVVLVTLVSVLGYSLVSTIEGVVLARFAPNTVGSPR
jgi:ABC-type nitrate/sulfonate/bicarbonate transport system permease component